MDGNRLFFSHYKLILSLILSNWSHILLEGKFPKLSNEGKLLVSYFYIFVFTQATFFWGEE